MSNSGWFQEYTHLLPISKTHLFVGDETQAQIDGFTFICKPRASGQGGGVGAYISSSVPFHRRLDLEQEDIECIWLEILFPKTKGFLIGIIYRPLRILQTIFVRISIANLSRCYRLCLRKTRNVY